MRCDPANRARPHDGVEGIMRQSMSFGRLVKMLVFCHVFSAISITSSNYIVNSAHLRWRASETPAETQGEACTGAVSARFRDMLKIPAGGLQQGHRVVHAYIQ